jgi:hypothetical protein
MATFIVLKQFLDRRTAALAKISALEAEKQENEGYLADREFWEKRARWLRENMPATESLGTAQAQLLEEIQNVALDYELQFQNSPCCCRIPRTARTTPPFIARPPSRCGCAGTSPPCSAGLPRCNPRKNFKPSSSSRLEIDSKAKEKTPQVLCNLVLARWFKPDTGL